MTDDQLKAELDDLTSWLTANVASGRARQCAAIRDAVRERRESLPERARKAAQAVADSMVGYTSEHRINEWSAIILAAKTEELK